MQSDHADHKRDLRLRRRLLQVSHAARVKPEFGWVSGRFLYDLIAAGHAEERDDRWKTWQPAGLDFTSYRITHRGTALVEQQLDPDPLVEDDRVRAVSARAKRGAGDAT